MNNGTVPNYLNMSTGTQGMPPQNTAYNPPTAGTSASSAAGGFGSLLPGLVGAAANVYGSQNAAQAQTEGNTAAIGTYQPQQQIGMGAMNTLADTLGTSGRPANYSNFLNFPGYQWAVDQGTRSINNQASSMGNLYTPNTLDAVGKYVAGTAMGDYNTYVNQLMGVAGFGVNANANISQAQINTGTARAGGYAGTAGAVGSFLNQNSSGIGNLINRGVGASNSPNNSGVAPGSNSGTDASGGYTDAGGNYIGAGGPAFNQGSTGDYNGNMGGGYDNSQTDYSQSAGALGGPG